MKVNEGYIQGVADALADQEIDYYAFKKKDEVFQDAYIRGKRDVERAMEKDYLRQTLAKRRV